MEPVKAYKRDCLIYYNPRTDTLARAEDPAPGREEFAMNPLLHYLIFEAPQETTDDFGFTPAKLGYFSTIFANGYIPCELSELGITSLDQLQTGLMDLIKERNPAGFDQLYRNLTGESK